MISFYDIQRGYEEWAEKPHNRKWVRKIDGTPIANDVVCCIWNSVRDRLSALSHPAPQAETHPDDLAVDRFAAAMKEKLARKRAEGRGGWDDKDECSQVFLSQLLREHVEKGDPVDVANLAMMIHQREERIASLLETLQGE